MSDEICIGWNDTQSVIPYCVAMGCIPDYHGSDGPKAGSRLRT